MKLSITKTGRNVITLGGGGAGYTISTQAFTIPLVSNIPMSIPLPQQWYCLNDPREFKYINIDNHHDIILWINKQIELTKPWWRKWF